MLILVASSHENSNKLTKHVSHCLNTESTRELSSHKIINSFETVYIGLYFLLFWAFCSKNKRFISSLKSYYESKENFRISDNESIIEALS